MEHKLRKRLRGHQNTSEHQHVIFHSFLSCARCLPQREPQCTALSAALPTYLGIWLSVGVFGHRKRKPAPSRCCLWWPDVRLKVLCHGRPTSSEQLLTPLMDSYCCSRAARFQCARDVNHLAEREELRRRISALPSLRVQFQCRLGTRSKHHPSPGSCVPLLPNIFLKIPSRVHVKGLAGRTRRPSNK